MKECDILEGQILWPPTYYQGPKPPNPACLGGSVGWDTVRTDRNGLSEEPGFNPR